MELKKRGVFFSADALIALLVILVALLLVYPFVSRVEPESQIQGDVLNSLSTLKISEIENSYVESLISSGALNETNKSVLEQIGEFYVTDVNLARNLAASVLENVETSENIGIWYGSTLIYSNNRTSYENSKEIDVERKIISGLQSGDGVTGFSARAFLTSSLRNKFAYFGGYVGDGNISARIQYNGTIQGGEIELVASDSFQLYVNGILQGTFSGSVDDFTPVRYNISISNFNSGDNVLDFRGNNLHIAGGFVKISYEESVNFGTNSTKVYLPGINGFVNLYDGVYVPEEFQSMEIFLHMNSSQAEVFVNLENKTLFNRTTTDEENIIISNSDISSKVNFTQATGKNLPFRLGIANASYGGITQDIDVFSVTDLSGSMCGSCNGGSFFCCLFGGGCSNNEPRCNSCGGTCANPAINNARTANNLFIDSILNNSGNRCGLAGYADSAPNSDFHNLSSSSSSLKSEVSSWRAVGGTCICCGINKAVGVLANSNVDSFESIVVMSDGAANVKCAQQGTATASQDAIQAACDAYEDYGITVHAIGFGSSGVDEATLQAIASCGNGFYYFSDVNELSEIYQQVAESIIAEYTEQTVELLGGVETKIYSDSYISISQNSSSNPFGLIVSVEKEFDDAYSGEFFVPADSQVIDARVTSYSGPRWTDSVAINGQNFYNLSKYGSNYISLGDPFNFVIPNEMIVNGTNNVRVTTGLSPTNSSSGSENNKIIYTLLKNASSFTGLKTVARGCNWQIQFEDDSVIGVPIPSDYDGVDVCIFNQTDSELDLPSTGNDAAQSAVFELLDQLDIDDDGKIDVTFTEQDLQISLDEVVGIPFTWSTEVQVRRWLP